LKGPDLVFGVDGIEVISVDVISVDVVRVEVGG